MNSAQNNNGKLKFISYAYALGAILVVMGHSTPTGASDMPKIVDNIRSFIYCFHMPLFFFIAGFLLKYTTDFYKKPYSLFIKKKAIRFLSPYLVFSAIGIIPKILLSDFVNDDVSFDWFYVFKAIFNPRENVWGHFWFLPTLLIIFVFSYFLLMCYKSKPIYGAIMMLAFLLAVFPVDTNWLAVKDICQQIGYFCSGILCCNYIIEKRNSIFRGQFAILAVVVSILLFILVLTNSGSMCAWGGNAISIMIAYLMLYAVFYVCVLFERKRVLCFNIFEGKTFTIYILSWPCQAVAEILFNRILNLHWYITSSVMFIVGIGIPLLFIYVYKKFKYHPKFINLVLGID